MNALCLFFVVVSIFGVSKAQDCPSNGNWHVINDECVLMTPRLNHRGLRRYCVNRGWWVKDPEENTLPDYFHVQRVWTSAVGRNGVFKYNFGLGTPVEQRNGDTLPAGRNNRDMCVIWDNRRRAKRYKRVKCDLKLRGFCHPPRRK